MAYNQEENQSIETINLNNNFMNLFNAEVLINRNSGRIDKTGGRRQKEAKEYGKEQRVSQNGLFRMFLE